MNHSGAPVPLEWAQRRSCAASHGFLYLKLLLFPRTLSVPSTRTRKLIAAYPHMTLALGNLMPHLASKSNALTHIYT